MKKAKFCDELDCNNCDAKLDICDLKKDLLNKNYQHALSWDVRDKFTLAGPKRNCKFVFRQVVPNFK